MKDPGSEPNLSCANFCIDGMMDLTSYFSPFLSLFLALIHFTVSELTPEQCRDLGFSVNLLCSSCDELKPFNLASEPSIEENCRKCCHADGQEEAAKFVRGADPVLKLHDENNEVKEVLSIEKWNTDSVEEFLNERLEN
ncbi:Selenoprotein F [Acropora cervicornis]|uniref:Selenoprotein F n=1 Tax=Acropora cervicornis TaxID=6130 RepID=A0AAD9QR78_ACRCE|nr:Selenoprotein F [Acropora cervicornis]